jgi:hypothetical protein
MRGRWRTAAGLALVVIAGLIAFLGWRGRNDGSELSDDARRFTADARTVFVRQVRTADNEKQLAGVEDVELVNRGAAFCLQLSRTGSSLKAVFALQLAGQTHPGDVYVTATARRVLCPTLPDADSRPTPG